MQTQEKNRSTGWNDMVAEAALRESATASGFTISHTTVEILGLCPHCRENQA